MTPNTRRVLFVSGSIGLGHVSRDVAIARELRRLRPDVDIAWLAAPPADRFLRDAGEPLLPECAEMTDESAIAEGAARGSRLNLIRYGFSVAPKWAHTVHVLTRVTGRETFDLVLGDETYGIVLAFKRKPALKQFPFVMIYDFAGFDAMTGNPLERLGVWFWNYAWSAGASRASQFVDLSLFIGEEADVPDRRFGLFLPSRRQWARTRCRFVGYVLPFDPGAYADRSAVRRRLGYGDEPLVVCAIGGTTTLELSALRRPFLYLPLEGHSEQQVSVRQRQERLGAGVRLLSWRMAPSALADLIAANLGTDVRYPAVPADGARRAAELVAPLIPSPR